MTGVASEAETRPDPPSDRRAWRVERRVPDRKLPIDGRQRTRNERFAIREAGRSQLRRGVVAAIEQIVDLTDDLQPPRQRVAPAEIDDRIAGESPGPR